MTLYTSLLPARWTTHLVTWWPTRSFTYSISNVPWSLTYFLTKPTPANSHDASLTSSLLARCDVKEACLASNGRLTFSFICPNGEKPACSPKRMVSKWKALKKYDAGNIVWLIDASNPWSTFSSHCDDRMSYCRTYCRPNRIVWPHLSVGVTLGSNQKDFTLISLEVCMHTPTAHTNLDSKHLLCSKKGSKSNLEESLWISAKNLICSLKISSLLLNIYSTLREYF